MLPSIHQLLDFNAEALKLRAERIRVLASNIANSDTPNFKARDFDFRAALENATSSQVANAGGGASTTDARHMQIAGPGSSAPTALRYRVPQQLSIDGNSVELDTERARFADNSVRYESSLRFLNGQIKTILSAIQGQ